MLRQLLAHVGDGGELRTDRGGERLDVRRGVFAYFAASTAAVCAFAGSACAADSAFSQLGEEGGNVCTARGELLLRRRARRRRKMKLIERPMARPAVAAMITSERATVVMKMDGLARQPPHGDGWSRATRP